jgi:hypothetical protein
MGPETWRNDKTIRHVRRDLQDAGESRSSEADIWGVPEMDDGLEGLHECWQERHSYLFEEREDWT